MDRVSVVARLLVAMVVALALSASCARRTTDTGAGDDVDVCRGLSIMEGFAEPSANEPRQAVAHVEALRRVVARIRPDFAVRRRDGDAMVPPEAVKADLDLLAARLEAVSTDLDDAPDDRSEVRASLNRFATDDLFNGAAERLSTFVRQTCAR